MTEKNLDMDILPELVGYNLRKAQLSSYRDFNIRIGKLNNITPAQLTMLLLVEVNPGVSQSVLGEAMSMDRASTMAIIDKLEKRNWLLRQKSLTDRRKHALHVLPQGKAMLKKLRSGMLHHEQQLTGKLDQREKKLLIRLLDKLQFSDYPEGCS
jgi:DNA-binding MarR family transcriptional regulator